ncbi:hypothetical protein BS17DRAFT_713280 [Gyrodon lividus]|nr:hypothetical protein BS17DRAFT_713280 [Gyrodon lividus]
MQPLEEHTYTPDGLLVVNPNGPHPIFELMRNAETEWEAKLARASKTLDEAVAEYKRRYRRPPPRGFDKWWDYVVKHNVQLPDEYDEIYHDLEPFWGIDPHDLAITQEELEQRKEIVTVQKTPSSSRLEIVSETLPEDRRAELQHTIENILHLLKDVQHELPPLRISLSPYDNPSMLSDWRIKNMALEAADKGTTIKQSDLPPIKEAGWIEACPPDSPARLHPPSLPPLSSIINNISSTPKTFVASHRATMDPCMHPSLLTSHGQFLSHKAGPFPQRTLVPRFSLCATLLHHDIRPPVPYAWTSGAGAEAEGDVPWDMKADTRMGWRGRTTGMYASPSSAWMHAHRSRLVTAMNALAGNVSVLPVPGDASVAVGEPEEARLGWVNPAWMDVAFAEGAVSCDEEGGTCAHMEALWEFRRRQARREEGRYKFIFDIDGNGWSSRFKRLVTGNALIFKATIYPEWFATRVAPWVHYVPIQVSYTDLHDAVAFFRAHDDLAARIAAAGKTWSQQFWREEDMSAYLYRNAGTYRALAVSQRRIQDLRARLHAPTTDWDLDSDGMCLPLSSIVVLFVLSAGGVLIVCVVVITLRIFFLGQLHTCTGVFPGHVSPSPNPPFAPALNGFGNELDSQPAVLEEHTYTPDGLLVVNPNGPHPIFELMRNAETEWEAKLARASKTLDEAVAEYKRRYRRPPPRDFDKWWDYVVKHNVQLPDEYDEIYHDLEPFWGIDPHDLAITQEELEQRKEIVTVQKTPSSSSLEIVGGTLPEDRRAELQHTIENILHLLKDVQHELPPLRISLSPYDNPSMLSDWRIKNMALEAADKGTTIKQSDLPPIKEAGWIEACPPDSPARLHPPSLPPLSSIINNISSTPKTFVASHRATMDPCMHPSLLTLHGQFLSHEVGPIPERTLVPRFSLCATLLHHDIRPPVPYAWTSGAGLEAEGDVPWDMKVDTRVGWRGRTTGMYAAPGSAWMHTHRSRLVTAMNALAGNVSVLPVPGDASVAVGEPEEARLGWVNPAWMDVAFADAPLSCDEEGGTCAHMEALWEFRRLQGRVEEGRYKFIFDIDGNGWSSRFKRLVTGNALIFKATIYPEWFATRVAPWVHYVPIQVSYTDLHDAVAFFRAHDDLAARIAAAGKTWSQQFWREEDMSAYLYRLLLEYARVSSVDREGMDYKG